VSLLKSLHDAGIAGDMAETGNSWKKMPLLKQTLFTKKPCRIVLPMTQGFLLMH
jgi:hypothetical protein